MQKKPRSYRQLSLGSLSIVLLSLLLTCFSVQLTQAVTSNGIVYAWGRNTDGQLGNGTNTNSNLPLASNLPSGVTATAISAGLFHSLAIGSDGKLYAWGYNIEGQLGNGTNTYSNVPVVVSLPSGVTATAISAGNFHNLAIGSNGKVYAWGDNGSGGLGNGTNTNSNVPVASNLPGGVTATAISAGFSHSLAIGSDSKLYAWGDNGSGELGNGTNTNSNVPVASNLPGGVTATAISAGYAHSLAIGSNGKLYAWGYNRYGELGNGTNTDSNVPVLVSLPNGVTATAISAGGYHSLAIGSEGKLYAWGFNGYGQLGNGTNAYSNNVPVLVSLSSGMTATAISAGVFHSLAIGPSVTPPPIQRRPASLPADLVGILRVTPDRQLGLKMSGDNVLVYSLSVKNIGPGKATNVSVHLPIDALLQVGYLINTEKGVWVKQIVSDSPTPYIVIGLPDMEKGAVLNFKMAMRAASNAPANSTLFTTFTVGWSDDSAASRLQRSNGVRLVLSASDTNRNETDGAVQFFGLNIEQTTHKVSVSSDFYAPDEGVDLWYTDKDSQSKSLGHYQADSNGKLQVSIDLSSWAANQSYVIAGRGVRTDTTGAAVIEIRQAANAAQSRLISVSNTSLKDFSSLWNNSK